MTAQLQQLIQQAQVPHALLFAGPEGSGKRQAALDLAEAFLGPFPGQHPDLHLYAPDSAGGMHTIDAMRRLIEEVYMAPFSAPSKVFIIEQADRMLPTSSNALLKTLEEPALNCYIILLTATPESILTTILSRVRKFTFHLKTRPVVERTPIRDRLVQLLGQKMGYAELMKMTAAFDDEEEPEKILEEVLFWYRDRHLLQQVGDPALCHFKAYEAELKNCTLPLPPLVQLFDKVEKGRFALEQHVKLRNILETLVAR